MIKIKFNMICKFLNGKLHKCAKIKAEKERIK